MWFNIPYMDPMGYPLLGLVTSSSRTHHSRSRATAALDDATHSARGKETDICSAQNPSQCRWGWKEPWYLLMVQKSGIHHLEEKVFIDPSWLAGLLPSTVSRKSQGISKWKLWFNSWSEVSEVHNNLFADISGLLLSFQVSIRPPTIVSLLAVYVRLCGWCDEFLQVAWRIDAEYFLWKCAGEPFLHLNGHSEEPQLIIHDIEYWYDIWYPMISTLNPMIQYLLQYAVDCCSIIMQCRYDVQWYDI